MIENPTLDKPCMPLCEPLDNEGVHIDLSPLEPAFDSGEQWLKPPPVETMDRVADHLAHKISRNPADLTSHLQRIALCHEVGDNALIYAAILDLFIALGNDGVSLRTRLLKKVMDLLEDDQRDALSKGLTQGIKAQDRVPLSRYSRLSQGVVGDTLLVEQMTSARPVVEYDTIDEARDLIDSGHIELAQKLLEESMLVERDREDISGELLGIYRHTRHGDALFAMKDQLGSAPFALEHDWEDLVRHFTDQTNSGEG